MSILMCPTCKKLVSDVLSNCPNCNSPVAKIVSPGSAVKLEKFQEDPERRSLLWFIVIMAVLILLAGTIYVNSAVHISVKF